MTALALILLAAFGLGGCNSDRMPAGSVIRGEFESTRFVEVGDIGRVSLAPASGRPAEPGLEEALRRSLERRRIEVAPGAAPVLRYLYVGVPATIPDPELGVGLAGSVGSSSSGDVGVGLELPLLDLFGRGRGVPGTAFDLELSLEGPEGAKIWRGRASGVARAATPEAVAGALVPVLLDRLGEDTARRKFLR